MLNAVDDAPDPCSPPVSGPAAISGTGPDVDNAVVTEQALLRMTVALVPSPLWGEGGASAPGEGAITLTAQTSASRNPGDSNEITKTLTVYWDAGALPDGLYTYTVSGAIVQFHQNHRGENTEPREFTKAASNSLSGTVLVDATPPTISDLNPPDGGFTGESQPTISASFSDSGSGIALASLDVKLDSWPVAVAATPTGFSFIPAYPLEGGVHTVTASLADYAGNAASVSWSFTAGDSIPPEVTPPQDVVAEAEFESGAYVTYPPATATDNVTGDPVITYSQESGTLFPLGVTTVVVTATDAAGNIGSATFQVTVQDTTPPVIYPPGDLVIEATSCDGALVYYSDAYAWDAVTSWPVLYYSQPSGSLFPIALTTVYITATDAAGNTGTTTFQVVVQDTTPPVITQPDDMLVEASSPEGASVWFPYPAVYDAVTAWPPVTFDPPSGAIFPLGTTAVIITATDDAANSSTTTLRVVVQDTTPPWIMPPGNMVLPATGPDGAVVFYPAVYAYDIVTPSPQIAFDPPDGSTLPLGVTTVTVFATDAAGNTGNATFQVAVQDTAPPEIANLTPAPGSFVAAWQPLISASISDAASGVNWPSLFVILDSVPMQVTVTDTGFQFLPPNDLWEGEHTVSATVYDNAANIAGADWSFTVDASGPQITDLIPPDGSAVTTARPLISAAITDSGSGVNWSSLFVTLDGVAIPVTLTDGGFYYIPDGNLLDGEHWLTVQVADNLGNTGGATWMFLVAPDTAPRIDYLSPFDGMTVYVSGQLNVSAWYSDTGGGVDPSSVRLYVDGMMLTEFNAYFYANAYYAYGMLPVTPDAYHQVTVVVADLAGHTATQTHTFYVIDPEKVVSVDVDIVPGETAIEFMDLGYNPGLMPAVATEDDPDDAILTPAIAGFVPARSFLDPFWGRFLVPILGLRGGKATLTADHRLWAKEVGAPDAYLFNVTVYEVTFEPETVYVPFGGTATVTATIKPPENAAMISFQFADDTLATVEPADATGTPQTLTLTAKPGAAGATTLRAVINAGRGGGKVAGSAKVNVVKVDSLTVESGATQENVTGADNWATVKSDGNVVVKANITPNISVADLPAGFIQWSCGCEGDDQLHHNFPKSVSVEYPVSAACGTSSASLHIWVIWTDLEVKTGAGDTIDGGNDATAVPGHMWPADMGGSNNLGPMTCEGTTLTYSYAIGKMQARATLQPAGIEDVVTTGWHMRRRMTKIAWDNGGHYASSGWASGPSSSATDADDSSPLVCVDEDPKSGSSTREIYDLDAPGCSNMLPRMTINRTSEVYANFTQYVTVTLDTEQDCSDPKAWSYTARIDDDKATGKVELNQVSTGSITIPTQPFYPHR